MSTPEGGLNVTLYANHVRVPNGMGSYKNVSLKDFAEEISRVAAGSEQTSAPKLALRVPNEVVSMRYNMHEVDLLLYFAENRRTLSYKEDKYEVPFPATVIFVKLKSNGKGGWIVEQVKWFCTDLKEDEIPGLDKLETTPKQFNNHLWVLPFPNQYGDGSMCIGRNSHRSLYTNDLRGLNELYHHILIASPFNDDLWHHGSRGVSWSGDSVHSWLRLLSNQESFPWTRMPGYPQSTTQPTEAVEADGEEDE